MMREVREMPPLDSAVLPPGIRARFVENVNGLRMHVLKARANWIGHLRKQCPLWVINGHRLTSA